MDDLSDLVGTLVLKDIIEAGVEGDFPNCDTLLNLRDFKSEALVLGNWTPLHFDDEAEGGPVVGVDG